MRRTAAEAAATRSDLVDAGLRVFADRGFAESSLADIAKAAGVTRGAAYHHFKDKAELYLAVVSEKWPVAAAPVWEPLFTEGPAEDRLREHLRRYFVALERNDTMRSILSVTIYKSGNAPGLELKRDVMRLWVSQIADVLAAAENPGVSVAAYGIVSTVSGVTSMWLADPDFLSPAAQADNLADFALRGAFSG
ncbi:TetR family transcriptional regulator [Allokutzneria sp. A3M-2-11 16]|uniref:TetR/AcrR family transcriptional regulator n=1 Tax=Allokutzneria sp. A3M-2-11 16 TaxID=2962043 RepID=UPI0020B7A354|nr:TetR family transcriptional regulator [Allokutzneria sp. A3M-2-11 16]MCP3800818.1 TetR family transcriptional regulator [Allokutzneria sp. A3M-2-11 16]